GELGAKERAGPCSKPWSTGRITNRPLPARRPWFIRRARLASVPGLSLPYQLRISRTRSLMVERSPLRGVGSSPAAAVAAAAARPAAAAFLGPVQPVAERLELHLAHPAHLGRVDLRVAVEAEAPRLAALVEVHVRQHLARAARAAGDREVALEGGRGIAHDRLSARPSAASSRSMWARCVAGQYSRPHPAQARKRSWRW